jgi:ABC-2 type transport system permease protein
MGKLGVVIRREYIERVRTRAFIISTLLVPILIVFTTVLPAWLALRTRASSDVTHIVIVDATQSGLGARVAAALSTDTSTGVANITVREVEPLAVPAAESAAVREVMATKIPGFLLLDSASLASGQVRYAGRNAASIADVERMESAVRQSTLLWRLERAGIDAKRVDSLTKMRIRLSAQRVTERGRSGSGLGSVVIAFLLAFLLYISIALYGQNVMRGVMEEKMSRVAEVVISSVKPETLLAGKIIGVGAVGLTQQVLWFSISGVILGTIAPKLAGLAAAAGAAGTAGAAGAGGAAAGGAAAGGATAGAANSSSAAIADLLSVPSISLGMMVAILLFFVLGVTFYCSLYAAVGATVGSEQEAQQAVAPIMFLLVPSIVFVQPVLLNPTGTLARALSWLPFSAPIITPLRMMVTPLSALEIAGSLASVAVACLAAVWLAARIYRVGLLMYGKRPSYRELVRWIRYSQ